MSAGRHPRVPDIRSLNALERHFDQQITSESLWAANKRAESENFPAISAAP